MNVKQFNFRTLACLGLIKYCGTEDFTACRSSSRLDGNLMEHLSPIMYKQNTVIGYEMSGGV